MNTAKIWRTVSTSTDETLDLAQAVGRRLHGGEVIELTSDLGGGKTTFVKGLAKGMGSHDLVHSPSFTLANQYQASQLTIYHLDLYRLHATGVLKDQLAELMPEADSVVVVEWPGLIKDLLPETRLSVKINVVNESSREFTFKYRADLSYLFADNT